MAQWSLGWTTSGTGDGISGGYTQAKFTEWLEALWLGNTADEGVCYGYGSALAVSASGGTASPVTIQTGAAMVKGFFYRNDAAGTKIIPTPAGSTRIDRIVLRADWGSQVVRFQRVAGTEGAGVPALTQTDETTWEIPLATVSITTGGVATVTDARVYLHPNLEVETAMIKNLNVTTTKLAADAVTSAKIADSAVGSAQIATDAVIPAKIPNRTRSFFVTPTFVRKDATDDWTYYSNTYLGFLMENGSAYDAHGIFSVPEDFASGMSVTAVWGPQAWSDKIHTSLSAIYGAVGTTYAEHTSSASSTAIYSAGSGANTNWRTCKPSVDLTSAAIGDYVQLATTRVVDGYDTSSDDVHFQGWKVEYTADS